MSACGFTWVYIALLGILGRSFQWLPARYIEGIFSLGYLVIILPLLGRARDPSQLRAQFWRQKNLINGGIGAWNTYAQISNIVSAVRFVPEAIGNVFHPVDTLSCLLGCILIPISGNESGKRHNSVFRCNGDIAGRGYFRIPVELAQNVLADGIVSPRLRSSCHNSPF
jgi:hypothetical protein